VIFFAFLIVMTPVGIELSLTGVGDRNDED